MRYLKIIWCYLQLMWFGDWRRSRYDRIHGIDWKGITHERMRIRNYLRELKYNKYLR